MFALGSFLLFLAGLIGMVVAYINTDVNTANAPTWVDWVAYPSMAAFCIGCLGLVWVAASWVWGLM